MKQESLGKLLKNTFISAPHKYNWPPFLFLGSDAHSLSSNLVIATTLSMCCFSTSDCTFHIANAEMSGARHEIYLSEDGIKKREEMKL